MPNTLTDKEQELLTVVRGAKHKKIVKLIEAGGNVNLQDDRGRSLMQWSAWDKRLPTVQFLLDRGADPNIQDKHGITPLMLASEHVQAEVVQLLVGNGADLTLKNEKGQTALDIAREMYDKRQGNMFFESLNKEFAKTIEFLKKATEEALLEKQISKIDTGNFSI